MQWLEKILPQIIKELGVTLALVLCFGMWAWSDQNAKYHLIDTLHNDMVRIEGAINKNTQEFEVLRDRIVETIEE